MAQIIFTEIADWNREQSERAFNAMNRKTTDIRPDGSVYWWVGGKWVHVGRLLPTVAAYRNEVSD